MTSSSLALPLRTPAALARYRLVERYAPLVSGAARNETPGTKFAGGHRSRVTPVPIPNTEVKPATADGTVWETAWESRSLPALIREPSTGLGTGPIANRNRAFLVLTDADGVPH